MTPYNINIKQGTDFHLLIELLENDVPVNLENASIQMIVRQDYKEDALAELSTANNKIKIDTDPGCFSIVLTAAETAVLNFKEAIYDVLVTNSYAEVNCIFQGKFIVQKSSTR